MLITGKVCKNYKERNNRKWENTEVNAEWISGRIDRTARIMIGDTIHYVVDQNSRALTYFFKSQNDLWVYMFTASQLGHLKNRHRSITRHASVAPNRK